MYDIVKSRPIAIFLAIFLTAIWLQIYILFVLPPGHLYSFGKYIWNLGEGGNADQLIITQFIIGKKIYQIAFLTFFDCLLLYFLKRENMSTEWKKSLLITGFAVGGLICCIAAATPRIEDEYKFINSIISNNFIIWSLQFFFLAMALNKICVYLPSFTRLQRPPRTEK